jgi:hypothetical protein
MRVIGDKQRLGALIGQELTPASFVMRSRELEPAKSMRREYILDRCKAFLEEAAQKTL